MREVAPFVEDRCGSKNELRSDENGAYEAAALPGRDRRCTGLHGVYFWTHSSLMACGMCRCFATSQCGPYFLTGDEHDHARRGLQSTSEADQLYRISPSDPVHPSISPPSPPPPGGPLRPICLALSISSHSNKLLAIPVALAIALRRTRKESYTPVCTGSMGSPSVRSRPAIWPSACSS